MTDATTDGAPPPWAEGPVARAGLLDLRVGRRAGARLRAIADAARGLAPGRIALVVLHGSRARGLARRGSDYDLAVFVAGGPPAPGFTDDLADLCLPHVLDGLTVHAAALAVPEPGTEPSPLVRDALRDGIAVTGGPDRRPFPAADPPVPAEAQADPPAAACSRRTAARSPSMRQRNPCGS